MHEQQAGFELQNHVAEHKIRAERRLGELLREMETRDGGDATRARLHSATELPPRLADLGIERTASHRWQTIATLDEAFFEASLAETKAAGRTQAEMAKALQVSASTISRDVAALLTQGFLVRLYVP